LWAKPLIHERIKNERNSTRYFSRVLFFCYAAYSLDYYDWGVEMSRLDIQEIFADEHERAYDVADSRIVELLNNEYSPYNLNNIMCAISDSEVLYQDGGIERMAELMEKRELHHLGRFVFDRIISYWEKQAEECAAEENSKFGYEER